MVLYHQGHETLLVRLYLTFIAVRQGRHFSRQVQRVPPRPSMAGPSPGQWCRKGPTRFGLGQRRVSPKTAVSRSRPRQCLGLSLWQRENTSCSLVRRKRSTHRALAVSHKLVGRQPVLQCRIPVGRIVGKCSTLAIAFDGHTVTLACTRAHLELPCESKKARRSKTFLSLPILRGGGRALQVNGSLLQLGRLKIVIALVVNALNGPRNEQ